MEEDQEALKHVCKFCNKSFPSGRSLGGHIRSHLINSPFDHTNKKHNGGSSANCNIIIEAGSTPTADYGLRENPKKTSKFDTLLPNQNKFCKECGKSFQSWKALFGHMKCHSDKVSSMNSTLEEESWHNEPNYAICHKQVMDSQSDSTETAAPNKKKRSLRKIKRYMSVTTSPCVSEIEQEEEEVAMSLIILSRDPGNWTGLNPFTKFSTNKDGELVKLKKVKNGKPEQGESSKSRIRRNLYKKDKSEVPDDKQNKIKGDKVTRIEESEIEVPNKLVKGSGLVNSESCSKRRNFEMNECDFNVDSNTKKKIKFQCTNCNKSFHSYQALGGHKASHKRTNKGCEKVVIDNEHLQNQAADSKLTKSSCSDSSTIDEFGEKVEKLKGYECPICFKIFQSGQALGGHKRSHLITESKSNNNKDIIIQKPTEEIRDLLDLNLPAPVEEESGEHVEFQPWWIGSSHKHEQLLGLISN
ncbi:zinc finger protein ZAT9-like [Lycium barbarum]|uniref:zinc finger protein ZAT9-like n=1 Tax=Lycium barbarum TaxID=112863 RepID=UPI00293E5044|nr:zinc finger protein ZAT9-like [Lycium barbarum]